MMQDARSKGYTIIEVLVFLAVSGALMASALGLIGGQQRTTQFAQAVREFDSRIKDLINDVSTGFYPNTGDLQCVYDPDAGGTPGSGIKIMDEGGTPQGANSDCIFIGRVVQFGVQGRGESSMRIYTVAGQRQLLDGSVRREPRNLYEAKARLIAASSPTDNTPNVFEDIADNPAISISKICYKTCTSVNDLAGGMGIFTTFGVYNGNSLQSGSVTANVVPITSLKHPTNLNQSAVDFVNATNANLTGPDAWPPAQYSTFVGEVQESGITICLLSKGVDQHARVKIGANSGQLTTSLTFHDGNEDSDCQP